MFLYSVFRTSYRYWNMDVACAATTWMNCINRVFENGNCCWHCRCDILPAYLLYYVWLMFLALLNQLMISLHNNRACDASELTDCGVECVSLVFQSMVRSVVVCITDSRLVLAIHHSTWWEAAYVHRYEQQCALTYRYFAKIARVKLCLRAFIAITNKRKIAHIHTHTQTTQQMNKNRMIFILKCRL